MAKKEVNKTNQNKNDKNKKTFFKSFKTELKKVVWPTPKQLLNNTVTVISIVIICAVIVFILDFVFETINKQGIERIRDAVVVNDNTTNNTANETNTTDDSNVTQVQVNDDGSTEVVEDSGNSSEPTENAASVEGGETVTE